MSPETHLNIQLRIQDPLMSDLPSLYPLLHILHIRLSRPSFVLTVLLATTLVTDTSIQFEASSKFGYIRTLAGSKEITKIFELFDNQNDSVEVSIQFDHLHKIMYSVRV